LKLLHCYIDRFWDTLYPQLDPEDNHDPTQRINILMALCDYDTVMAPVKGIPLCASPQMGVYSLQDIKKVEGKLAVSDKKDKPAPEMAAIEAAFKDCEVKTLRATSAAVSDALLGLIRLEKLLQEKVGPERAPEFGEMRQVLEEIDNVLSRRTAGRETNAKRTPQKKPATGKPTAATDTSPALAQNISVQGGEPMKTINSRQDVVRMLDQICVFYDQNEPASPVPLLLRRAKQLVEKNFLEIIKDVAPESVAQIEKLVGPTKEGES
jgi:type VI secretion system protein ImpA